MKEYKTQLWVLYKLLLVAIFASLYALGGMYGTWIRRFLAPLVLFGGLYLPSRDWRVLVGIPLMMITLSMGYGANTLWEKITKRAIYGYSNALSSGIYGILKGMFVLVGFHIVLCIASYIVIGVINPFPSARAEETFLGAILALIPALSVKDREE